MAFKGYRKMKETMLRKIKGDEGHQLLRNKKRRRSLTRRDSMEVAAEDLQEATVTKTLSELASLVVLSLEPIS